MSLPREWCLQDSVERDAVAPTTASQEMVGTTVIDENMNQQNQLGSLLSIHSAPVFDLSTGVPSPKRPASLAVQATATSTPVVPPHLQSPETIEDEDNDNLLTISSLTARPLIAKSRELRSSKNSSTKKKKPKKSETKKKIKKYYIRSIRWWLRLDYRIRGVFRSVLGDWTYEILWSAIC